MIARPGAALAIVVVAATATAAAAPPVPAEGRLDYVIARNGEPIGSHAIVFRREGQRLVVETKVEIVVKMAMIAVYRFTKTSRETWLGGNIVAYEAQTDDDGKSLTVAARADGGRIVIEGASGDGEAPLGTLVSGYWNIATVRQTRLIDSENGDVVEVEAEGGDEEGLTVGGRKLRAHYWRLKGKLARDLWYGEDGLMLAMRSVASDDSVIETVRVFTAPR